MERATDDPKMLIVTYEGEHRHVQGAMQENNATPAPSAAVSAAAAGPMVMFEST